MKLLYEKQSPFKLIQVFEDKGKHLLLLEGRQEIHSEYDPGTVMLRPVAGHYWNILSLFGLHPSIKKVLIIGLGAGTCARQMLHYRHDLHIEGVEVDKEIVNVGEQYFGLDTSKVNVHYGDAIKFLKKTRKKYDYIVVDAFIHGNLGRQFITTDFYRLVKLHLNPRGIVAVNYFYVKDWGAKLSESVSSYFRHCRQVGNPGTYNFVIVASDVEYDISKIKGYDDDIKRLKNFVIKHIQQL